MELTIDYEKGYSDATQLEDTYQWIKIDLTTLVVIDKDLIFESDIPELSHLKRFNNLNVNDLHSYLNSKGWRLC